MMNPAKFVLPHLDTPSSRYKYLKFAFKYVKINKENQISNRAQQLGAPGPVHPEALTAGAHSQRDPTCQTHRAGARLDRRQTRQR